MQDAAVIDAYLGSHQDVDLGVVTGRVSGEKTAEVEELLAEIDAEVGLTDASAYVSDTQTDDTAKDEDTK